MDKKMSWQPTYSSTPVIYAWTLLSSTVSLQKVKVSCLTEDLFEGNYHFHSCPLLDLQSHASQLNLENVHFRLICSLLPTTFLQKHACVFLPHRGHVSVVSLHKREPKHKQIFAERLGRRKASAFIVGEWHSKQALLPPPRGNEAASVGLRGIAASCHWRKLWHLVAALPPPMLL